MEHSPSLQSTSNPLWFKDFLRLALPISVHSVLMATLGIADVIMVSGLGEEAIAAVGLGAKLHFISHLLVFGFCSACSTLISQYLGANQVHKVQHIVIMSLIIACLLLLPLAILFGVEPQWWLSYIVDSQGEVLSNVSVYISSTAWVVLLTTGIMVYEASLRAFGDSVLPLFIAFLSVLVNVFLNYLLIEGHWGAPALGVLGAGLATLFARLFHLLMIFILLYYRRHPLRLRLNHFNGLECWSVWKSYSFFAVPIALNYLLWGLGSALYHFIAAKMGTEPLAVMSILAPIESIIISLFAGVCSAAAILLGRSLGADDAEFAWYLKKFFIKLSVQLAVITCLVLWMLLPWIMLLFGDLSQETSWRVELCLAVLFLCLWMKVHNMIAIVSVLRAGGDNVWCLKLDIVAMWVIGLPLTAFVGWFLNVGFEWVVLAMFSEELIKVLGSHWRMNQRKWMNNLTNIVPEGK